MLAAVSIVFLQKQIVEGLMGIQTQSSKMEGANESTRQIKVKGYCRALV